MTLVGKTEVYRGDCLSALRQLDEGGISLAYLDPPFLTQKSHRLSDRGGEREFSFDDTWASSDAYAEFMRLRLEEVRRVVSEDGSVFVHCDRNANHIMRGVLDDVFGADMFRSEIIWHYRRWSNSRKGLLPAHQTIYYYTKSSRYTFNRIWQEYSPSTNVDQILQRRARSASGKVTYERDGDGNAKPTPDKKGVPLGDVWDIPYLNPKARERTGYPTQKPILLMERIISISTNEGDTVLDPFCGSGTTLVAAKLMGRHSIGIDISEEAVNLTRKRLDNITKTQSRLAINGRDSYRRTDRFLYSLLWGLDYVPVQRNKGIDAILKSGVNGTPVPIRVQRDGETALEAARKLHRASKSKGADLMFLIATSANDFPGFGNDFPDGVVVIDSPAMAISDRLSSYLANPDSIHAEDKRGSSLQ